LSERLKAAALLAATSGGAAIAGGAMATPARTEKAATAAGMNCEKRCIVCSFP
jgi:hypothetical protein